jgi:ribosomal protein L11 methyltransferase
MRTAPALDVRAHAPGAGVDLRQHDGAPVSRPDLFQAALMDFDVAAVDETSPDVWRVYFQTADERDRARTALARDFPDLRLDPVDVPDEDWAAQSQAGVRAVRVGNIIVAPPWDVPLVIPIKPSTGFGTGHHATTRLCLQALQGIEVRERAVLDVGTGSGVLAIAASLLGAGPVTGVDDDADATQAAWDNLALNPGSVVSLLTGDFRTLQLTAADVVLANLTGGLLIASARPLRQLVSAHGRLILSGFQTHEEAEVVDAFAAFTVERRLEEEGWVCLTLT